MKVLSRDQLHPRPELAFAFFSFGLVSLGCGVLTFCHGSPEIEKLEEWARFPVRWLWPAYFTIFGLVTLNYWWRYGMVHDFSEASWRRGGKLIVAGFGALIIALVLHRAGWPAFLPAYYLYRSHKYWHSKETRAHFNPERLIVTNAREMGTAQ